MRRGAKPSKAKVESKRTAPPKSPMSEDARVRDLEERLAEALKHEAEAQERLQTHKRELVRALEKQTATTKLLKVIGRSTFDLQSVFELLAENAVRLCKGKRGVILRFAGSCCGLR